MPADNVKVVTRFRPVNQREREEGKDHIVVEFEGNNGLRLKDKKDHFFTFDHVFGMDSTQDMIFQQTGLPLIDQVLNGYNCTLFAYGQTGSGKTFTMEGEIGNKKLEGLIPRMVRSLFAKMEQSSESIVYTMTVSYLEIYNEKLKDLLDPYKKPTIRGIDNVQILNNENIYVESPDDVFTLLHRGHTNRSVAETKMNSKSSRSHAVFIIEIKKQETNPDHIHYGIDKISKLLMVDLAGSEKVKKTEAKGQNLEEAKNINQSLSCLGNVINALTKQHTKHVPYRNSILTRLLRDALGGNSKTCLIICNSPALFNADETLSTLRFGKRAKSIKNNIEMNEKLSPKQYELKLKAAKQLNIKLQNENEMLKKTVKSLNTKIITLINQAKKMENTLGNNLQKISDDFDKNNDLKHVNNIIKSTQQKPQQTNTKKKSHHQKSASISGSPKSAALRRSKTAGDQPALTNAHSNILEYKGSSPHILDRHTTTHHQRSHTQHSIHSIPKFRSTASMISSVSTATLPSDEGTRYNQNLENEHTIVALKSKLKEKIRELEDTNTTYAHIHDKFCALEDAHYELRGLLDDKKYSVSIERTSHEITRTKLDMLQKRINELQNINKFKQLSFNDKEVNYINKINKQNHEIERLKKLLKKMCYINFNDTGVNKLDKLLNKYYNNDDNKDDYIFNDSNNNSNDNNNEYNNNSSVYNINNKQIIKLKNKIQLYRDRDEIHMSLRNSWVKHLKTLEQALVCSQTAYNNAKSQWLKKEEELKIELQRSRQLFISFSKYRSCFNYGNGNDDINDNNTNNNNFDINSVVSRPLSYVNQTSNDSKIKKPKKIRGRRQSDLMSNA